MELQQKVQCVRYSGLNDRSVEEREPELVEKWIRFNTDFRPEQALFVDGECRSRGRLSAADCGQISAALKAATPVAPRSAEPALPLFAN